MVYAICLARLEGIKDPLAALNMAMHVVYRFSHLRLIALMLVTQVRGSMFIFLGFEGLSGKWKWGIINTQIFTFICAISGH